jgi:hypothetical protein
MTYHDRDALLVGGGYDGVKVGHVIARVADALNVDGLGLVVDEGGQLLGFVAIDKLGRDAQAGKDDLELVVGAAVQVRGRDNVVAGVRESGNGEELGGLAGGRGKGTDTAFEGGDALLKDVDRGAGGRQSAGLPGALGRTGAHFMIRE